MTRTDVVVVGLGIHGSAAAYELAHRGVRVVGLDQFGEGHVRGSSHGRTRMIRRAYPNAAWNDLVDRAFAGWQRWEQRSGRTLVRRTGGLYAHPGRSQLQGPGTEALDAPALRAERMPSFAVPAGHTAVYDPAAGVVEAADALDVARTGARAAGAELAFAERVLDWEEGPEGVTVQTTSRTITAAFLVLTAGAWSGALVRELSELFDVWRILTLTLPPGRRAGQPPALGCFSIDRPEGLVFGLPDVAGSGVKVGVDAGEPWDPEVPPAPPSRSEVAVLRDLVSAYLPGVDADGGEAVSCLYTMTEDRRFVVGHAPGTSRVALAAACSGHGFKFGPAIGEALADLATGAERPDLEFVSVGRRLRAPGITVGGSK